MKIAFYSPLKSPSHPSPSGDREVARSIYHYFVRQGADVFLLSEFRTRWFYRSPIGWLLWLKAFWRAYRRVRAERPDVFFTYHLYYKAPDPIGFALAWWFGKPYVVLEGMYARKAARKSGRWIGYWLTRMALRYAHKIFSDKTENYNFLVQWFAKEKVVHLPPSVDMSNFSPDRKIAESFRERFGIAPEEIVISTVAMLRPNRKSDGVRFLIDVLAELREEGFLFRWLHAGAGSCYEEVRAYAKEKLGPRALLLGGVDQKQIAALMRASDVFTFPGIDEGLGLVYLEAQAAGLPVLAFEHGAIPSTVKKGETALLTPFMDRMAYKDAMRRLLKDPLLRKTMGNEALYFVRERFDADKNYAKIWSAMKEAVHYDAVMHPAKP